MKDSRLGPRRADVTHWRCRRLEHENDKKGTTLFWEDGDDGIEVPEWPIKSCSSETIVDRWGPGRYVVDYVQIDAAGVRRPRAHSRVLHVTGRAVKAPEAEAKVTPAPTPPPSLPAAPGVPAMDHNIYTHVFSMLAYLEERGEKARAAAAAEAKQLQERYRTDVELMMERERLASKERIAQIEAQARTVPARGGAHFDSEALALRIGEVVGDKIQEALGDADEANAMIPAPAMPQDNTAAIVSALKDTLAPILSVVVAKLAAGPTLPDPLPSIGGNGGNGPNGEPN